MSREQDVVTMPEPRQKKRFFNKRFVVLVFLGISLALLVYAFTGQGFSSITGSVVVDGSDGSKKAAETDFEIRAELSPLKSYLEINQGIDNVVIELKGDGSIYFGDGALNLSEAGKTLLELEDFRGVIVFDANKIYNLNGDVFKVSVNKVATTSARERIRIGVSSELDYEFLSLDSVYLKKYNSASNSGSVVIDSGKLDLKLNEESFDVSGFNGHIMSGLVGNFGIRSEGFILDGSFESVSVGSKFSFG